ncbi:MAG TPA: PIN domain-containing protein [Bacteroidales bacterium]|nr:PIN domain-containing protein [Bacteroidales bacterium]
MIHSVRFTCVLDTNVIYPIDIRDLLFWFAYHELYTPKWSKHIFDEWKDVMIRKGISQEEANKRIQKAQLAFPDALVKNYEFLIDGLNLPDEKDRHVLAAAIKTNANLIVTNNIKDFPKKYLARFGLSAKRVDDFITDIIDLNQERAVKAFKDLVLNRTNPDLDEFQILDRFRKNGLKDSANYIHSLI